MEFENLPNNNQSKSESAKRPSTEDLSSQDKNNFGSCMHSSTMLACIFALFVCVLTTIGIIIVCLTSSKPSETCTLTFRQMNNSTLTFSTEPTSVGVGDLNNDSRLDIVVANTGTHNIGIFLSTNNGTFMDQQIYSTGIGSRPRSITIKDFNDDIFLDIAVANYGTNNIGIFFGNGNGTFNSQKIFSTGSFRPLFISSADFNKDNYFDVAIVHYGTASIGILLGHGDGSFQQEAIYSTGYDSAPSSLAIGDFNNDNQLDIAVSNYGTDTIGIFLGFKNGTFASQKTFSTTHTSNPSSIAVGHFNDDNQLDIFISNYNMGSIYVFLGDGEGGFSRNITYLISSKSNPGFIEVGYMNHDKYLDVVVTDSENDQLHILLGSGNESFSILTTYDSIFGAEPIAVVVTDFDNDNQSDVILVKRGTNDILVMSNYSIKPALRSKVYFVGRKSRPSSVLIYDFNNDSTLDIAVNNVNDNYILIQYGIGDGTFVNGKTYPTGDGSSPQYQSLGDFNNDHRVDMAVANIGCNCIGIFIAQEDGTFAPQVIYSTGVGSVPWYFAIDDVNNDNLLDIVTANSGSSSVGVLFGHGDGTFASVENFLIGASTSVYSVALSDVNHDKFLDILVPTCETNSIIILLGYGNGTFAKLETNSTVIDSCPDFVAVGDLNEDSHADIVSMSSLYNHISIFLGNGDGTFRKRVDYSTGPGSRPYSIVIADYNGDSKFDLGVANFGTNEVMIFFGNEDGTFQHIEKYSTDSNSNPYAIAFADLNNDGRLEIIVTYWGTGCTSVLTQYYAATFSQQITYLTGAAPESYSLAFSDFNNDNISDIVVANSGTNDLSVLMGLPNGKFYSEMKYFIAADAYPQYVITGDLNKDGHMDIISISSKINSISIMMGYGNGTFASQIMYSTGYNSRPYAVALGNFNNDELVDCVIANEGTDNIGVLLGFNYASFQGPIVYTNGIIQGPAGVVTGDFNRDHHLDIAVVFQNSYYLSILLGYGNGSFGEMKSFPTGNNSLPNGLAVYDLNNDTYLDIVVTNYGSNNLGVFLGYGNGSFASMVAYACRSGSLPNDVAIGDLNNDRVADIVSANGGDHTINIFIGYGNGTFAAVIKYYVGDFAEPYAVAIADFNNDGQLDLATANYGTSTTSVFLGYGNGSFALPLTYIVGYQSWPWWIVAADFNNDSYSDIAVSNYANNEISVLIGLGSGNFTSYKGYPIGDGSSSEGLSVGDFNNDNILDIAIADSIGNFFNVLYGFGDGTFLLGRGYTTGTGSLPMSIAVGDFNRDTRLDVVLTNYESNTIMVFLGYGYEYFTGITKYTSGDDSEPHSVAVGDFNNDGLSDVVVANYGTDNVGVFLNDGHGAFNNMTQYFTGAGSAPFFVAIGDFNNDSQSDIACANYGTNNVVVLLGHANGTFTMTGIYSTGAHSQPSAIAIGDINKDDRLDLVIANFGTSTIFILHGYGNGTFGNETSYTLGYNFHPLSVALADVTKNSWLDIIIACFGTDKIETLIMTC